MDSTILISGGTGMIGSFLSNHFITQGFKIYILTRQKKQNTPNITYINKVSKIPPDVRIKIIINLAGAPINKRWSNSYKQVLFTSRINITSSLVDYMLNCEHKPELFISASAIGFYGSQNDNILNEASGAHEEFTHKLCKQWEDAALRAQDANIRTCIIRLGVVLDKKNGALPEIARAFKFGVGGKIASGKQYFSWIHRDDLINGIDFLINHKELDGVFNFTSPNPVTSLTLTTSIARAHKRPHIIPLPAWLIKLLFGEMGQALLTNGQRVIPSRLLELGFNFKYPCIEEALATLL